MTRVLLLAGTAEARELASALADLPSITALASLAGATQRPRALDLPTRIGGFGGLDAFISWLKDNEISAILDATHPFAEQISENAQAAATSLGLPCLQILRPAWQPESGDSWHMMESMSAAAGALKAGQRVFLATGRTSLESFKTRNDCWFLARVIDPNHSEFPLVNGRFTIGKPPFSVEHETAVLRDAEIDVLITKNAGGENSTSKLVAARNLQIPVFMIERPKPPDNEVVATVDEAMNWVRALSDG